MQEGLRKLGLTRRNDRAAVAKRILAAVAAEQRATSFAGTAHRNQPGFDEIHAKICAVVEELDVILASSTSEDNQEPDRCRDRVLLCLEALVAARRDLRESPGASFASHKEAFKIVEKLLEI